jgi:hypothetical protein
VRFSYFERLSAKDKRIYLRSDEIRSVKVPDVVALQPLVGELRVTLEAGKRIRATKAANGLVLALCKQLGAPNVRVRIHETRPSWDGGELHGLYTFAEPGEVPEIEVWMRTVAKGQIVRFRTFMRTLLHEVGHHLDATIFEMPESFHTHGFFARESSLVKQMLGEAAPKPAQLDLFSRAPRTDPRRRTPTRGE